MQDLQSPVLGGDGAGIAQGLIQQAIHQQLSPVWEPDFSASSYGFRPGRSAHDAFVTKPVAFDTLLGVIGTQLGLEWQREAEADTVVVPAPATDLPAGPTVHGSPGAPPPDAKMEDLQMIAPMEYGDREAQPEATPGGKRERKG